MKILSWNLNGLKSAMQKGLMDIISSAEYDILAFQEIKNDGRNLPLEITMSGYNITVNPAVKAGYSGTMTMSKFKPVSVSTELSMDEGRVLNVEMENFYFLNCYFPNSRRDLSRLDLKMDFNNRFMEYCLELDKKKPLIICGDFNVAHEEIDIARPADNHNSAGFTDSERQWFSRFLDSGFVDTFRIFHKEGGMYSWWSYMNRARERNIGWRIDYFVVSRRIRERVRSSEVLGDITGSDHAPIFLEIDL